MSRLASLFEGLRREGRTALMPFLTGGYPDPATFVELLGVASEGGADLIEVGIPFSDPLADGPTIQRSSQAALEAGASLGTILASLGGAPAPPSVVMSYVNPVLAMGIETFAREAERAGVIGAILPDLPPEEGEEIERQLARRSLDVVYLLAPNSSPERIDLVCERSGGFVYLVSLLGTTGARDELPPGLETFVRRVRRRTEKPVCLGFGISRPEHARAVAPFVDGVIVGSALIDRIDVGGGGTGAARSLLRALREALDGRENEVPPEGVGDSDADRRDEG